MGYLHIVLALALNAIPICGVLALDWSIATVIVLFWLENLLGSLVMCVRIWLHRTLARSPEHWNEDVTVNRVAKKTTYLVVFALMTLIFTFGHGVFVGAFAFLIVPSNFEPRWAFSATQFEQGAWLTLAVLVLDLLVDLPGLRQRSFAWLRGMGDRKFLRVIVLHVGLIFGFMAMAGMESPMGLLYVLMGIKTLVDMASARPGALTEPPTKPRAAPGTNPAAGRRPADARGKRKRR